MKQILIVDDVNLLTEENVQGFAEIWVLKNTDLTSFNNLPIVNVTEITSSFTNDGEKFKEVLSEIYRRHSFEYKVLTDNKEKYKVSNYICEFL